jgi:hypothetical protein
MGNTHADFFSCQSLCKQHFPGFSRDETQTVTLKGGGGGEEGTEKRKESSADPAPTGQNSR